MCYFLRFVICDLWLVKFADHGDFDRSRSLLRSFFWADLRSLTDHEKVNAVHERRSRVRVHLDIANQLLLVTNANYNWTFSENGNAN